MIIPIICLSLGTAAAESQFPGGIMQLPAATAQGRKVADYVFQNAFAPIHHQKIV